MRGKTTHRLHFRAIRDALDEFDMDWGKDERYKDMHGHVKTIREQMDHYDGVKRTARGDSPGQRAAQEAAGATTDSTGQPSNFREANVAARERMGSA